MELIAGKLLKYNGHAYVLTDDEPQNGDWVLTEKYGVWEFRDETGYATAPMPYWANKHACKKIIATDDKSLKEKYPEVVLILKK
jgi:hypothetical protein